jgi:cell division septation protein DedD
VAASAVAGYYLGGGTHPSFFASQPRLAQPAPLPTVSSGTPDHTVKVARATDDKADYTAPDGPDIQITEVKQPKLNDESNKASKIIGTPANNAATPDPEASQQGTLPADQSGNPPTASTSSDTSTPDNSTDQSGTDQTATSSTASDPTKSDYEKITTPTDPEASQQGAATTPSPKPVKFTYRVQTGTFAVARNARILADALRGRGYDTSLRTETQGDQTLYRVQTGAYQSKSAANAAADALRASGYPAYVSPITQD